MGFEFMMCFIKEFKKENIQKNIDKYNSPKLDKNILTQKSPMTCSMIKIKSEEDFVKLQVPWIL